MSNIDLIGWQSWSDCKKLNHKLPYRNYSPFGQNNLKLNVKCQMLNTKSPPHGWCSWHWFATGINEKVILDQAQTISNLNLKLDHLLIDDGWCTWGDWLTPNPAKFPHGLKWLVKKINDQGLKAGIWFAPLMAKSSSRLFKSHPDWFIKDKSGHYMEGTKMTPFDVFIRPRRHVLDLLNPHVTKYLDSVLDYLQDCGFELLKLDFLYANHFNPEFNSPHLPDSLLHQFLSSIHDRSSLYTIAYGCPLAPAVGAIDAMHISDDINFPQIKYIWPINKIIHVSRLDQLHHNYQVRQVTKPLWHLDLDAFICHPSFGLSHSQITKFQALIKDAGGPIFLGDNLKLLSPKQITTYIFPLLK